MCKKINIIAPIGGFGNHVAWLIWSNLSIESVIKSVHINETVYNSIKGSLWPEYKKINLVDNTNDYYNEMCRLGVFDYKVNNPAEFILQNVYHRKRSWHNWLQIEWKLRTQLKDIDISHNIDMISDEKLNLLCCIDPDLAYRNYIKVNSSFNNQGLESFFNDIEKFNKNANNLKEQKNILVVDNSDLFKKSLDYDYYNKIISFLNLNNDYETANIIHNAWITCQERSEQEFLNQIQQLYSR